MNSIKKIFIALVLFTSAVLVAPGNLGLHHPAMEKAQAVLAIVLMLLALVIGFISFFREKQNKQETNDAVNHKGINIRDIRTLDAETLKKILMEEKNAGKYLILEK